MADRAVLNEPTRRDLDEGENIIVSIKAGNVHTSPGK
jgi:hypothetical protein